MKEIFVISVAHISGHYEQGWDLKGLKSNFFIHQVDFNFFRRESSVCF